MSSVFNICFRHKEATYTALLTVPGGDEKGIHVSNTDETIHINLPTGRLSFSIPDLIHHLVSVKDKPGTNGTLYITDTISMILIDKR